MKPMTAAEYAAHAEAVENQRPSEIKTLKSGAVFELRRPDLERMVQLGLIPQSLLDEGVKAWEAAGMKSPATSKLRLDADVLNRSLILMREVVSATCVNPPFNEATAKYFLKQDFNEIFEWAMRPTEGLATEGLRTFRKGRKRRTIASRPDSAELQPATISTAEN